MRIQGIKKEYQKIIGFQKFKKKVKKIKKKKKWQVQIRHHWCTVRLKCRPGKMSLVFSFLLRLVFLTLFHRSHRRTEGPHRHLAVLHHLQHMQTHKSSFVCFTTTNLTAHWDVLSTLGGRVDKIQKNEITDVSTDLEVVPVGVCDITGHFLCVTHGVDSWRACCSATDWTGIYRRL